MLVVGVAVAAGCSSSGGSGSGSGEYSIVDAVDQIPESIVEDEVMILTGDLVAASDAAGVERPDDLDDAPLWLNSLTGVPGPEGTDVSVFVPIGDLSTAGLRFGDLAGFEDELGWSILDLDSFVEVTLPPTTFAVLDGDFGDDPLDRLDELGDGVFTYGSGDDLEQDIENRNPVDQLGRPIRFGYENGRMAMSTVTPAVEQWLGGDGGDGLDDLAAMAAVLDDADAYAAVMRVSDGGFEFGDGAPMPREMVEAVLDEDWLPTEPFHAVAIGWSVDDGDAVVTMVFAHDDADAASDNVERFEAMLSDGISLRAQRPLDSVFDLVDVTSDDDLVVVTVTMVDDTPAIQAFNAMVQRDAPFVHE